MTCKEQAVQLTNGQSVQPFCMETNVEFPQKPKAETNKTLRLGLLYDQAIFLFIQKNLSQNNVEIPEHLFIIHNRQEMESTSTDKQIKIMQCIHT